VDYVTESIDTYLASNPAIIAHLKVEKLNATLPLETEDFIPCLLQVVRQLVPSSYRIIGVYLNYRLRLLETSEEDDCQGACGK